VREPSPAWTWRLPAIAVAAVALGLVLRLAFGLLYWNGKPLTHDEREYLAIAANVAAGRGFSADLPGEPRHPLADRFDRAPLYPLALAPLVGLDADLREGRLPPDVPAAVQVAQGLVGAATAWLLALLARRMAGERAAVAAAGLAALYPPMVWMPAYALSETLAAALAMAAVAVLGAVVDRRGPIEAGPRATGLVVAAGALIGLATLTRPSTLLALPLVALYLCARRRPALALLVLAGAAATIAPWTVRNAREHGRLVLVSAQGGVNFWIGNHPLAVGDGDLAATPDLKRANLALRARHPGLDAHDLEPVYYREALDWMRREPAAWLGLMARKAFYTVAPLGPSYRLHSARYYWASVVPYLLLLPIALLGARAASGVRFPPVALALLLASAVLASLVFFPHERFRLPIVDPALVVLAAGWIGGTATRERRPS
jgi:4-amino-4-deoxy-L-arabinose transferase-like glycosyltransferase